jgi:hypothetical protein
VDEKTLSPRAVLLRGGIWPPVAHVHADANADRDRRSYGGTDPDAYADENTHGNADEDTDARLQRERHAISRCPICDPDSVPDLLPGGFQLPASETPVHPSDPSSGHEPERRSVGLDGTVADPMKGN